MLTARTLSWYTAGWSGSTYDGQSYFQILDGAMNVKAQIQTPQSDPWVRFSVDLTAIGLALGDTFYFKAVDGKSANNYSWLAFDKLTLRGSLAKEQQAAFTVNTGRLTAEYGSSFAVSTIGGSGSGAVSFSVTGVCSNTAGGSLITMTASSGTCTITATKAADANFLVASASASVTATKATQPTLAVVAPAYANPNTSFTATITGGGGTGAVVFSVGGSCSNTNGGALISMTGSTGGCQIIATKALDANYFPAWSSPAFVTAGQPTPATIDIVQTTATVGVCVAGDPQCNPSTSSGIATALLLRLQSNGVPVATPAGGVSFTAVSNNTQCVTVANGALVAGSLSTSFNAGYGGTATLPCTATVTVSTASYGSDTVVVTANRYANAPLASAAGAVSYFNPAPLADGAGGLRPKTAAVSYYNPAPISTPNGVVATNVATVSYYNPALIPTAGGDIATNVAAVSYYNPATVPNGGGVASAGMRSVSYFNPEVTPSSASLASVASVGAADKPSGDTGTVASSTASISVVNGPAVSGIAPVLLSRTAAVPYILTITGANLWSATSVTFVGLEGDLSVDQPIVSDDGRSLTVNVYVLPSAPLGIANVVVSGPGWSMSVVPAVRVEIVP